MKLTEAKNDVLVGAYIKFRDEVAQIEAKHKAELVPLKTRLEKIENEVLRRFNETGTESIRTNAGTAFKQAKTSVTVADWDTFLHQYVIPKQAWEMLEHRANKTSVVQYKGENGDLPPGVNYTEETTVQFRRA